MEGIKGYKVSATHQVCRWRHKRQWYTKIQERRANTYPRSSRKRQITFATISSFFSSAGRLAPPGLTLVRAACFSVAVAPRQSAKSIVEDCQGCYVSVGISSPIITFSSHFAHGALLQQSHMERANQQHVERAVRLLVKCVTRIYSREASSVRTKMHQQPSGWSRNCARRC